MIENYPEIKERLQSTFIDAILIIVFMFLFASILDKYENMPDWARIAMFVGPFLAYEPICMAFGATLGNYVKGIRVRQNSNPTKRINIFQAIIRFIVKFLLGWVSFLTINNNPKRRAMHDIASGSVMIKL